MKRKCLAVGIILLFVGVAIAPSINAHNDLMVPKVVSSSEKEVSIVVLVYKPDGTVGKSVIKMTQWQSERLRVELNGVSDLNSRLSIYKKYNLIPQNVTVDTLREGMEEKAQNMGLTQEKLAQLILKNDKNNPLTPIHVAFDLMCSVSIEAYLVIPIGLSLIYLLLDFLLLTNYSHRLVGVDFSIRTAGNDFRTHGGLLPDISLGGCSIWGKLIGFVGYVFPYRTGYYTHAFDAIGFSAYVRVIYRPY